MVSTTAWDPALAPNKTGWRGIGGKKPSRHKQKREGESPSHIQLVTENWGDRVRQGGQAPMQVAGALEQCGDQTWPFAGRERTVLSKSFSTERESAGWVFEMNEDRGWRHDGKKTLWESDEFCGLDPCARATDCSRNNCLGVSKRARGTGICSSTRRTRWPGEK